MQNGECRRQNSKQAAWRLAFCILHSAFCLGLIAGCGGKGKTHPVFGKVQFADGSPLRPNHPKGGKGKVIFELKLEGPAAVASRGEIQEDGTFTLSTFQPGDGAPEGTHKVLVVPPLDKDPLIDPKFQRFETSGLEFTVAPGKNEITITVEKAPPGTKSLFDEPPGKGK